MAYKKGTEESNLFFKYCMSFVFLYGRIPVKEAFDIIQYQNDAQFSLSSFLDFLKNTEKDRQKHYMHTNTFFVLFSPNGSSDPYEMELVNDCYEYACHDYQNKNNPYRILVDKQKGRLLYMPPKEDLLKYADDTYNEITPEMKRIADWVLKNKCKLPFRLTRQDIYSEVCLPLKMDSDYFDAFESLMKWIDLPDDEDIMMDLLSELFGLIVEAYNNTRTWYLRGHTPYEMREIIYNTDNPTLIS